MTERPRFVCLDLEGVLIPEIWGAVSEALGDPGLARTTRDSPDYVALMEDRLAALRRHGLRWPQVEAILSTIRPLPGAEEFLAALRGRLPFAVVTDSFDRFVACAARGLALDTVLCHSLALDAGGGLAGWRPRIDDSKRAAALAFGELGYEVAAAGDSLNDLPMLEAAERGILFRPSHATLEAARGRFPVCGTHRELLESLLA